jgi:hypothetical protein
MNGRREEKNRIKMVEGMSSDMDITVAAGRCVSADHNPLILINCMEE